MGQVYEGVVVRRQYRVETLYRAQKILSRFLEGKIFPCADGTFLVLIF